MKRTLLSKALLSLALSLLLSLVGCKQTFVDDMFDIHREIDLLKDSHKDLQQRLDNLNQSIFTIQTIIDVLNSGYYVEWVAPVTEEGKETGYTFHFTNGREIVILHGQDGADGHNPVVGVTVVDGKYYWTLDGELLLDGDGNMVSVLTENAITPSFSISNGFWYLSFDGGATWKLLGPATGDYGQYGQDGVQHFIRVDISSAEVAVFVLADGTVISIPRRQEIRLLLDSGEEPVSIGERETIDVPYRLTASTENTLINVSSDGYYMAKVIPADELSGVIRITCPRTYSDGFVNVLVFEDAGIVDSHLISFYEKNMEFSDGLEFEVAPEGGTVVVPYRANFPYHLSVDPQAEDWLTVIESGDAGASDGDIIIETAPNDGVSRTGAVYIIPDNSDQVYAAILITQQSLHCTIEKGSFVIPFEGGTFLCGITTDYEFKTTIPDPDSDWLKAEILSYGNKRFSIAFTVEPNPRAESRASVIDIVSTDGLGKIASIRVLQNGRNLDLEYAMVFIVNPNYSNDFTAYLPIDINNDFDCFVDWGDGTGMRYRMADGFNSLPEGERNIHHKYEGLTIGRRFEVVVSGTVTSLNADVIPLPFRSSVVEVKQWGKTGLRSMDRAFAGFSGLTTLHLDETGAFEDVDSFDSSFEDCPRLTTISGHLFDHARKATRFNYTFRHCNRLAIIPENLFANAESAESFEWTFSECKNLTSIPEDLFAHCNKAKQFRYSFYGCESLTSVPAGLFAHNPEVIAFDGLFLNCHSLTSIPTGFFDANTEVTSFSQTFESCHNLAVVPTDLLDHQLKVINCSEMFFDCGALQMESPCVLVGEVKVHLYERNRFPDYFVYPWQYAGCFAGCHNLLDYEMIPADWK